MTNKIVQRRQTAPQGADETAGGTEYSRTIELNGFACLIHASGDLDSRINDASIYASHARAMLEILAMGGAHAVDGNPTIMCNALYGVIFLQDIATDLLKSCAQQVPA